MRKTALMLLILISIPAFAVNVNVNCNQGQSIRATLTALDRQGPNIINIRGICTERVDVRRFEHLTLIGRPGAAIVAPSDSASGTYALQVRHSRDVVIRDLNVRGGGSAAALYFEHCQDCQVENSTIERSVLASSVSELVFFKSVFRASGDWTALSFWDNSVAYINDCTLEPASNGTWSGITVGKGAVVTIGGTSIRGFQVGLVVTEGGIVDLAGGYAPNLAGSNPDQTVVIDDSWLSAISVNGAHVNLDNNCPANYTCGVRLGNNGGVWWGGAIDASGNGSVGISGGVEISGSKTYGVRASTGAYVGISGPARIVGSGGNGLEVTSNSTVSAGQGSDGSKVQISGSGGQDISCDATAVFTGAANVTAGKISCTNLN